MPAGRVCSALKEVEWTVMAALRWLFSLVEEFGNLTISKIAAIQELSIE
jgi:hypothetical protein